MNPFYPALMCPELGSTTFTVVRSTFTRVKGQTTSSSNEESVTGCIHPGSAEMAQMLPEEYKGSEFIVAYAPFVFSEGSNFGSTYTGADVIQYNGAKWRVVRTRHWPAFELHSAYAVRVPEDEVSP